jgi:hypothetical protein
MNQPILLYRIRDLAQLANVTFLYISQHYRTLLLAALCGFAPLKFLQYAAINAYAKYASKATFEYLRTYPTQPFTEWRLFQQTLSPALFITFFLTILINLAIGLVVSSHIIEYEENSNEPIGLQRIWERIESDLIGSIGLWISLILLISIAAFLLLIPAVYLIVPFSITLFVYLREGKSIRDTLSRSLELVRGYWWPSFGFLLVMGLIQLALSFGVGLFFTIVRRLMHISSVNQLYSIPALFGSTVDMVTTTVLFVGFAFLYYNLLEIITY